MIHIQSHSQSTAARHHHSETQTMQTRNSPKKVGNYNKWNDNQRLWMLEWATNHLDYWLDGSYTHIVHYTRLLFFLSTCSHIKLSRTSQLLKVNRSQC